jgi:hypothetical protein
MAEIYDKLDKIDDAIKSRTFSIDIPENGGHRKIFPDQLSVLGRHFSQTMFFPMYIM